MRFFVLILVGVSIAGCSIFTPLQKSKFITVKHLITTNKFNEAKGMIDDLVSDKKASRWPQTWYYKGLLCQSAHQEGVKKNDKNLQELYPDQLFVALEAYDKARKLRNSKRYNKRLLPQYVRLVNDLQRLGQAKFNQRDFKSAQKAFEMALMLNESSFISQPLDTNLLYNAALAAFENNNLSNAVKHLWRLDGMKHSVNSSHLLYTSLLNKGDSVEAKQVLERNIKNYPENEKLVLLLADHYLAQGNPDKAIETIEKSMLITDSVSFALINAKGLVFQNTSRYTEAIEVFEQITEKFPNQSGPYANIATCYFNIGVEIEEKARAITSITLYQAEKERSVKHYNKALQWIEKALEKKPGDTENQNFADRLRRLAGANNNPKTD